MSRAIYPGSFDPITYGHIDVLKRALKMFDEVYVLLAINENKTYRFNKKERITIVKEALKEEGLENVPVYFTDGLTTDCMKKLSVKTIIRGIRSEKDKEYENKLALGYKALDPSVEVVLIKASDKYKDVSSTSIYERLKKGEDVSSLVPPVVIKTFKGE